MSNKRKLILGLCLNILAFAILVIALKKDDRLEPYPVPGEDEDLQISLVYPEEEKTDPPDYSGIYKKDLFSKSRTDTLQTPKASATTEQDAKLAEEE